MDDRARQWLLLAAVAGAGTAFGALSAASLLNFLSRSKRREGYVRNLLESNGGTSGSDGLGTRLRAANSSDLLSDEVVSEQLTSHWSWRGWQSCCFHAPEIWGWQIAPSRF